MLMDGIKWEMCKDRAGGSTHVDTTANLEARNLQLNLRLAGLTREIGSPFKPFLRF